MAAGCGNDSCGAEMRKVIPLIAGALLAGAVGLLKDGHPAEKPRARAASKEKAAPARHRGPHLKARRAASAKTTKRAKARPH